jgi:hypothetical protein
MLVPIEVPILISSNPTLGNVKVTDNGSSVEVVLNQSVDIPQDALSLYVEAESTTMWNTNPNVILGVNDTIIIDGISYFFPEGLYDLTAINKQVALFVNSPTKYVFTADDVSGKLILTINSAVLTTIDFATMYYFFGYNPGSYSNAGFLGVPYLLYAPKKANFNYTNYYLVHCNLVPNGLLYNNSYSSIVTDIPIEVGTLEQIVYTPTNPCRLDCGNLAGSKITSIKVWITDDSNRLIKTNDEYFSVRLSINYMVPRIIRDKNNNIIA